MDGQAFYNIVALELRERAVRPGLWARAVAETGQENSEARARYIQLRVTELMHERESLRLLAKLQKEQERERESQEQEVRREKAKNLAKLALAVITGLTLLAVLLKFVFE